LKKRWKLAMVSMRRKIVEGRVRAPSAVFARRKRMVLDEAMLDASGGRCEIRTHGAVAGTPVFKTGALDHSANLPVSRRFWSRHNLGFAELVSPEEARVARVLSRPVH
jgi:hypothetical protein